jgi:hypothetical protein
VTASGALSMAKADGRTDSPVFVCAHSGAREELRAEEARLELRRAELCHMAATAYERTIVATSQDAVPCRAMPCHAWHRQHMIRAILPTLWKYA